MLLRTKLTIWLLVPLLTVLSLVLYSDWSRNRRATLAAANELITERANAVAAQIDTRIRSIMRAAEAAAVLPPRQAGAFENAARQMIIGPLRYEPAIFATIVSFDGPGNKQVALAARRLRGGIQPRPLPASAIAAAPPWLAARTRTQGFWTTQFTEPSLAPGPLYAYAVPVVDQGEVRGVLAFVLRGGDVQGLIAPPPLVSQTALAITSGTEAAADQPGPTGLPIVPETIEDEPAPSLKIARSLVGPDGFVVIDTEKLVVTHSNPKFKATQSIFKLAELRNITDLVEAGKQVFSGKSGVIEVAGLDSLVPELADDGTYIIAYGPIQATGWIFTTALGKTEVMRPVNAWLMTTAMLFVLGLVAVVIVVMLVSGRITRPIEEMAAAVDRLGRGDLSVRLEGGKGRDELARLARGFNTTVTRLAAQMQRVRDETAARERIEGELKAARTIQEDLLPRIFPAFPGEHRFDLFAVNTPAKYVAGDFYDFFIVGPRLIFVIADVSGKGVAAAILMAVTRTLIRGAAAEGLSVTAIARRVNDALCHDSNEGMFVTLILGSYDPSNGSLEYIAAGHPPPIVLRRDGPRAIPDSTAPMLGAFAEELLGDFASETLTLAPGEGVLLYTDGVTEAMGPGQQLFGELRLCEVISAHPTDDAATLCQAVNTAATNWQHESLADDITVLVLRRTTLPEPQSPAVTGC